METITILGATGSIGQNTLNVLSRHLDHFEVFALTAYHRVDILLKQCAAFKPRYAVLHDKIQAVQFQKKLIQLKLKTKVLSGVEGLCEVASHRLVKTVMAAIVGAAGLEPTLAAAKTGKKILLANKEVLVMAGELFMKEGRKHHAQLLPVDSEHSAIFQSMPKNYVCGEKPRIVQKIILTASGGPFRKLPLNKFFNITPSQAIAHPNWKMGKKISVDSATMINKALEMIEAHFLFGVESQEIDVVIHPESIVHSCVQYVDGSVIAQMGNPDMRTPIAYALAYPERIVSGVNVLDLAKISALHFEKVDHKRFAAVELAMDALKKGGTAPAILNAANEIAVEAFLNRRLDFLKISDCVKHALKKIKITSANTLDEILKADCKARECAEQFIVQKG